MLSIVDAERLMANRTTTFLRISNAPKGQHVGGFGACAQALFTLSEFIPKLPIRSYCEEFAPHYDSALKNFARHAIGACAITSEFNVYTKDGGKQLSAALTSFLKPLLSEQKGELKSGDLLSYFSIHSKEFGDIFSDVFYSADSRGVYTTRNEIYLKAALPSLFQRIILISGIKNQTFNSECHAPLAAALSELLTNAHEWGATNEHNQPLTRAQTILYFRVHQSRNSPSLSSSPTSGGFENRLQSYISQIHFQSHETPAFLEIGLLDNGLGIARRFKRVPRLQEISFETELDHLSKAFQAGETSSYEDGRGGGLPRLMRVLTNLHGYFYVRTGRAALFRDFIKDKLVETEQVGASDQRNGNNSYYLSDWKTSSRQTQSIMEPSVGTFFNILIPLREAQTSMKLE